MRPSDVNALAEIDLLERVKILSSNPNGDRLPALVPFATYGLVFRVHEAVARLNNARRLVWSNRPLWHVC